MTKHRKNRKNGSAREGGGALRYGVARMQRGGAQLLLFFAIVVALAAVSFALQNSVPVTVTFIVWRFDGSLAMVLLLAVALGALAVSLVAWPTVLRARWALARERRKNVALEAALREARPGGAALPEVPDDRDPP